MLQGGALRILISWRVETMFCDCGSSDLDLSHQLSSD